MPNISEIKKSKFLKKEDVAKPMLATITGCVEENVAKEGAPEEFKWCLTFRETDKPLVLNSTNAQLAASLLGSDNTDDWTGKKIVLYNDPSIQYQGKLTGGVRVRAPRGAVPPAKAAPAPAPADDNVPMDQAGEPDDTPF